jgi:hypothetical protein
VAYTEEDMKKLGTMLVLAGLVTLVASMPAAAQATWNGSSLNVKFTVPMAFYVGDKLMPAGSYEVTQTAGGSNANTLLVRGTGKNEAYVEFTAIGTPKPLTKMDVTFNKYGNKEYLNSINWPGTADTQSSWILQINPSAGEQAAAKAAAAAKHTVPGSK